MICPKIFKNILSFLHLESGKKILGGSRQGKCILFSWVYVEFEFTKYLLLIHLNKDDIFWNLATFTSEDLSRIISNLYLHCKSPYVFTRNIKYWFMCAYNEKCCRKIFTLVLPVWPKFVLWHLISRKISNMAWSGLL